MSAGRSKIMNTAINSDASAANNARLMKEMYDHAKNHLAVDEILDYTHDRAHLDKQEIGRIESHINSCDICQTKISTMEKLRDVPAYNPFD